MRISAIPPACTVPTCSLYFSWSALCLGPLRRFIAGTMCGHLVYKFSSTLSFRLYASTSRKVRELLVNIYCRGIYRTSASSANARLQIKSHADMYSKYLVYIPGTHAQFPSLIDGAGAARRKQQCTGAVPGLVQLLLQP